jgi:hypothetical protein
LEDARLAEEAALEAAQLQANRVAEKRRVKLLQRLTKQRARQQDSVAKKREAEEAKKQAKAKEELGLTDDKGKGKGKKSAPAKK